MATLPKSHIEPKSEIKILYSTNTAREKPQRGEIIALGPLLLSTTYVN
jgi:co-chaperonin GroES (HSP10)